MGNILREAVGLAKSGIKEINLIAQDTTSYGKDIYGSFTLTKLIRKLAKISGIEWIRIMYAYPGSVTDGLLELFNTEPKLCPYIDIPLQHVSKSVLKRMKRPLAATKIVERIIEKAPGVVIRTSLIVGFPGETEREFSELKKFVSEGLIDHLGVFSYSDVEGASSLKMIGKVPDGLKEKRKDILMRIQQKINQKKNEARIGSIEKVFVEKFAMGKVFCRSRFQAPEIDSRVIVKGAKPDGSFMNIGVTGLKGYDLVGKKQD
jgi:ribosomal protein S12 methylthiotransferase